MSTKMRFETTGLLMVVLLVAGSVSTTSSTTFKNEQERFLISASSISFTTFTLIKSTTTVSSTVTFTTTCTTSTAVILTCTTGRRRRGLFYDETKADSRHRRAGLFHSGDDFDDKENNVFLPIANRTFSPVNEIPSKSVDEESLIPLEIQPGFSLPKGVEGNRFLLAFGVSTRTSVFFTTSTFSLTAICSSTTGFPLCGAVGK